MTIGCVRNSEEIGLFRNKCLFLRNGGLSNRLPETAKWACVRFKTEGQVEPSEQGMGASDDCQGEPCIDKIVLYSLLDFAWSANNST